MSDVRIREPESAMLPGMASPRPRVGIDVRAGLPDTSGPQPQPNQEPGRWVYDIDPGTGSSRATFNGEVSFTSGGSGTAGVTSFNTRTGAVVLTTADLTGAGGAPLANPTFTGTPAAPTAVTGTNTTQLATTAFVINQIGATPTVTSFNGRQGVVTLTSSDITSAGGAPTVSPALTGTPTAPTALAGNQSSQIATTQFVSNAISGAVVSWNGRTGAVTLTISDITSAGGAPIAAPAFTGIPTAPTAAPGTATTQLATTAFVTNAVTGATTGVSSFNTRTGAVTLQAADVSGVGGALLASPTFTGTPSAPTATAGTNTTQLATTAFVAAAVAGLPGVTTWNGRAGAVTLQLTDVTTVGGAPLASPTFTGVPAGPTATQGTNTTQLATTAFVATAIAPLAPVASPGFSGTPTAPTAAINTATTQIATTAFVINQASATTPLMNGVAAIGVGTTWARADHVHPTDTTRAPLASPVFTGNPQAPTPVTADNSVSIATTAFVKAQGYGTVSSVTAGNGLTGGTITGIGTIALAAPVGIANGGTAATTLPVQAGPTGWNLNTNLLVTNGTAVSNLSTLSPNGALGTFTGGPANISGIGVGAPPYLEFGRCNGSMGSPTAVLSGQTLFGIWVDGYGLNAWDTGARAQINANASENWNNTAQGTSWAFQTTAPGTITTANTMVLGQGLVVGNPPFGTQDLGFGTFNVGGGTNNGQFTVDNYGGITSQRATGAATYGTWLVFRMMRGTAAAPTPVLLNDALGEIDFQGQYNTAVGGNSNGCAIKVLPSENWSATNRGSQLQVWTTANGTTAPATTMTLDGAGNLTILGPTATKAGGGSWVAPSDRTLKSMIEVWSTGLDAVLALNPISYRYNNERWNHADVDHIGLDADDAALIIPEMARIVPVPQESEVTPYEDHPQGSTPPPPMVDVSALDHGPLVFALVNSVKELSARIDAIAAGLPPGITPP